MAEERGWTIVARNRRFGGGEADVLGVREQRSLQQGLVLEVKSSKRPDDHLSARVSAAQRRRLFAMADTFLDERALDEVHVVVVTAHLSGDAQALTWLELDRF